MKWRYIPKPVPWQWLYRTQDERPCWRLKSSRLWQCVVWVSSLSNHSPFTFRTMQSRIKTLQTFGISGTACPTTWYHAYIFCNTVRISKLPALDRTTMFVIRYATACHLLLPRSILSIPSQPILILYCHWCLVLPIGHLSFRFPH